MSLYIHFRVLAVMVPLCTFVGCTNTSSSGTSPSPAGAVADNKKNAQPHAEAVADVPATSVELVLKRMFNEFEMKPIKNEFDGKKGEAQFILPNDERQEITIRYEQESAAKTRISLQASGKDADKLVDPMLGDLIAKSKLISP